MPVILPGEPSRSAIRILAPGAMDHYDLAIVGAGIVGLAHAWRAQRAGLSLLVVDRELRSVGVSVRNFGFVTITGQRVGETMRRVRALLRSRASSRSPAARA